MNIHKTLLCAGLITLLGISCHAATTTDGDPLLKNDDSRLQQKVSIQADGLRVAEVVARLSQSTGVEMTTGINKDDWLCNDRKVIVYVSDVPLRDLMSELSRTLSFRWSRSGDAGKWTYQLWQDSDQEIEEAWLRSSAEDAKAKETRDRRESAIADLSNLGSLSASDSARLKETDPWRYVLAADSLGRDIAELLSTYPEARNAFVRGLGASFPVSTLSPQLQETVKRIATSYDALAKSIGASEDHSEMLSSFNKLQVTINRVSINGRDVLTRSMLGRITISAGVTGGIEIPIFDPSSRVAKSFGAAVVKLRAGASKEDVGKLLKQELEAAADAPQESQASSRDLTSDPTLQVKLKLSDEAMILSPLPVVLKSIADKTKLNVLSDFFPVTPPGLVGGERTLGEQLEIIRKAYGSNWEKAGSTLRLRDSEWFKKRAWEVPQVWIDYWANRGKRNDGLNLEDYVRIGNLRDEQIDHTIMLEPRLVRMGAGDAARNRHILRFYGALTDEQRTTLVTSQLIANALTDQQWSQLKTALGTAGAAYAAATKGSQTIRLTQSGSDVIEYKFSFSPGQGTDPVVFLLASGVSYGTKDEFPENKKQ